MLADHKATLEMLGRQVDRLEGELEELRHEAAQGGPGQGAAYRLRVLEDRIHTLELGTAARQPVAPAVEGPREAPSPPPSEAERPKPPESAALPEPAVPPPPSVEEQDYRLALQAMERGSYDEAIRGFRGFRDGHPRSPMADDALFWVGEAYYSQGKYYEAILAYNDVLREYGTSDKAPAALLKQASAFSKLGSKIDARVTLKTLIRRYPDTPEAEEARKSLQMMGG